MSTIYQVAEKASVSVATVSRVLSQPDLVRNSTRERVLKVIEELEYVPNRAAQSLRTYKAGKILVSVPDISNPFFSKIIRGAEEAARDAGYSVVLGDTRNDAELENLYAAMLRRGEVDGFIFLGHRMPESLQKMVAEDSKLFPIVNGCEFSPELPVSSVHIDNFRAAADVAEHLAALGHTKLGVITGPPIGPLSRDRLAGVHSVARASDLEVEIFEGDFTVQSGFDGALALVDHGVTAIFCFSDEMAIGALSGIGERDLSCPRDVSVVGFDDIRFAKFTSPPLSTIHQPMEEIGRHTVDLLLQAMNGDITAPISVTLPHSLVVRDSVAPPPVAGSSA